MEPRTAPTSSRADPETCDHADAWYHKVVLLWLIIGWAPAFYGMTQGWPWAGPVFFLHLASWVVLVIAAVGELLPDSCHRCGYTRPQLCGRCGYLGTNPRCCR